MKDFNDFDSKIKDKLEQLHPTYSDDAWQRFAPFIQPPNPWLGPLKTIAVGAGTVALLYSSYQLKQKSIELKRLQSELQTKTITVHDTIYVNTPGEDRIIERIVERIIKVPVASAEKSQSQPTDAATIVETQSTDNTTGQKIPVNNIVLSQYKAQGETTKGSMPTIEEIEGVRTEVGKNEKSDKEEVAYQPVGSSTVPEPATETARQEPPARKVSKTPAVRSQIGVFGLEQNAYKGLGLNGQFRLWGGFSVNTGIEAGVFRPRFFEDEDDFEEKEYKEFRDKLPVQPAREAKFNNIEVRTHILQIPLAVQYDYDLPLNFGVFVQAGTRLKISSKENVKFESSQQSAAGPLKVTNPVNNLKTFNNLIFNLGLSYQFRRLSVFASPQYQFNFGSPVMNRSNTGLRIGTQIKLYK